MTEEFKKQLKTLALEKVDQITQISKGEMKQESVPIIRDFFELFAEDDMLLRRLYQAYKEKLPSLDLHRGQGTISYTHHDHSCTVTFLGKQFSLDEATYANLLSCTIEIMREMLPLGSVVELDPAYFKPDEQSASPSKAVITGRFVGPTGYHSYFPYVGVIYPVGEIKEGAQIHFTDPLIKTVVHRGFRDKMEEAFVLWMKRDFILEKDLCSIEFAEQDMTKLQYEMNEKQKVGDV